MSFIKQGIYIGNFRDAADLHFLQKNGVTHVLCSAAELFPVFPDKFAYKHVQANDIPSYNLSKHFDAAADFIQGCMESKGTCFIHCAAGISRSVSLTIAYFIKHEGMTFQQAISLIKSKRYIANPNPGFVRQLKDFEMKCKSRTLAKDKNEPQNNFQMFNNTIGAGPLYVTGNNFRGKNQFLESINPAATLQNKGPQATEPNPSKVFETGKPPRVTFAPVETNKPVVLPPATPLKPVLKPTDTTNTLPIPSKPAENKPQVGLTSTNELQKPAAPVKQPDYLIKQYSKTLLRQDPSNPNPAADPRLNRAEEPRKPPLLVNGTIDGRATPAGRGKSTPMGGFGGPSAELFNRYLKVAGVASYNEPRIATHPTKQAGFRTSQNFRPGVTQPTVTGGKPGPSGIRPAPYSGKTNAYATGYFY